MKVFLNFKYVVLPYFEEILNKKFAYRYEYYIYRYNLFVPYVDCKIGLPLHYGIKLINYII
jgi:hypothetical protein